MLDQAIANQIERIETTIGVALAAAGLGKERIDTLILTGGSTQVPAIMAMLQRRLPQARIVEADAFGSVGIGLALDARRKFG